MDFGGHCARRLEMPDRGWTRLARRIAAIGLVAAAMGDATAALAGASMQIAPILVDLEAPAAASTIDLTNQALQPASIQVRVFAWTQADGKEGLTPTNDVVASPPFATIASGAKLSIRVIRATQRPVKAEEAYRVVIDQLPEATGNGKAIVSMLLRQVLPVFFAAANRTPPEIAWSIQKTDKGYALFAHNSGDRRLRIVNAILILPDHRSIKMSSGLLGYVLGHSDMSWAIPGRAQGLVPGASATIHADGDMGVIVAKALVTRR